MANTYVIQSVTHINDAATVTGTVNGTQVSANFCFSSLTTFPNTTAAQSYLANLLLAAFNALQVQSTAIYNGTITQ
jgi:hypothetical protein